MSGLVLWGALGLVELYLLLAATLGAQTYHKGYRALAIMGAVLPLLWLIGACLPEKRKSSNQTPRSPVPKTDNLVEARLQSSKWDGIEPAASRRRKGAGRVPAEGDTVPLANRTTPSGNRPVDRSRLFPAAPPALDERMRRHLEFLRWLAQTGRLEP
jgi:hypothetical protein